MALHAMHKLNSKAIPGSNIVTNYRFGLNHASSKGKPGADKEFNSSGCSKGYGFIRFANEEEQKNILVAMNGYRGLGTKSLIIYNTVAWPWNQITEYCFLQYMASR
ncbi:uncharacterized protein [Prorops nasuta]|uniref:uncharacterized protein n=1 Tax=Prorops nasuta TaxID=863751 RepID=UPI0034CF55CA